MNPTIQRIRYYYRAYKRLELMNKAASLSFYTLVSIFPMVLLLVGLLGHFFSPETLERATLYFIQEVVPYESELVWSNLRSLFGKKLAFSWFGGIALFLSAQMLYVNMEKLINGILHTTKQRHFLLTRLFFILWLLGMVSAILAPVIIEMVGARLAGLGLDISVIGKMSARGGFMLIAFLVFCLVVTILPTRRLHPKRIALGALLFAITVQIGKLGFKWFTLHNFDRYNLVYGSLSSLVLGTLWIFYFYNMFLFFIYWVGREHDPLHHRHKGLEISRP